ncbi:L-seryl-tRNA(Sec) selenium transferase (EC [Olavius algarvensis associated proteobacterium Delta 3]|nr:L-seryl-tRNA(Sec) selenium transferase (EC [Olavius algarvensis associated proteobacterium Delta 3]CAB5102897.1 L-seryl-tRNA(Sec) selenium transferase (EC [Olavius algarvensis associated proteobacterium Delta 3]
MNLNEAQQKLLRMLPGVDRLMETVKDDEVFAAVPPSVMVSSVRSVIEHHRHAILEDGGRITSEQLTSEALARSVKKRVIQAISPNLQRVVNATGVVIHTNLGRSLLAQEAIENVALISGRYSNLEYDLEAGKRGSRYSVIEDLLCEITGAEAGMVVNNNAGAVLLTLDTLARGKKAVVSRGELVEIGGSFRIPDVMVKSGAILTEVGTTNRTHLKDYENAIDADTGLLMKVHRSNYSVVGFTAEVPIQELAKLGQSNNIPVMEDLGSGMFIDLSKYGLIREPTVQDTVASGADVVTFSGDKLLGGPQAGIIVGKQRILDKIKTNPITRTLRIDKMTLAALETTFRLYREEEKAISAIPTLQMLTMPMSVIEAKAAHLMTVLDDIGSTHLHLEIIQRSSKAGGGSLPLLELPTRCVSLHIRGVSVNSIERAMRSYCPPIIGRIEEDRFMLDPRTLQEDDPQIIADALSKLLQKNGS